MAEVQNNKSRRDQFGERLKTKYPDKQYADDEELFGQINDDYDDYEGQINSYKDREKALTGLFNKDARSAQFITDMAKGNDPFVAMIERIGIDGITQLLNDPSKKEAYSEANKKYVERLAKNKSLEDEFDKNLDESLKLLASIQQQRGLSDETMDAAYDLIIKTANEALHGKFTEETVSMALNAVNHDADVQNAAGEGEVRGRNAKIEEKLRQNKKGDGTPNLSGSHNTPQQEKKAKTLFDIASEA